MAKHGDEGDDLRALSFLITGGSTQAEWETVHCQAAGSELLSARSLPGWARVAVEPAVGKLWVGEGTSTGETLPLFMFTNGKCSCFPSPPVLKVESCSPATKPRSLCFEHVSHHNGVFCILLVISRQMAQRQETPYQQPQH